MLEGQIVSEKVLGIGLISVDGIIFFEENPGQIENIVVDPGLMPEDLIEFD